MKNVMENFKLVIIVAIMVAHLPLLMLLIFRLNNDTFHYLNDKSVYRIQQSVEYDMDNAEILMPHNLAAINLDLGAVLILPIIADDYGPKYNTADVETIHGSGNILKRDAQVVEYAYEVDNLDYVADDPNIKYRLSIFAGWDAELVEALNIVVARCGTGGDWNDYADVPLYMMWNSRRNCWFITSKFINIFKEY